MQKKPLLICDWDCTLAEPVTRSFYAHHRIKTEQAIARTYNLSREDQDHIFAMLDKEKIRIEKLLSDQSVSGRFNLSSEGFNHYETLMQGLNSIDPKGWFKQDEQVVETLRQLKPYMDVVVLSNSPAQLISKIGSEIGFEVESDFDAFYTMTAEGGSPKFVDPQKAMETIVRTHNPDIAMSWSIGDSPKIDLEPARELGMNTALVDNLSQHNGDHSYSFKGNTAEVLKHIRQSFTGMK